mmetsp:Transcript_38943/g.82966  ORF Transcript_38943/g.82966 Transcript_38943/m.82966 type:complete len:554 (-) Transcript_38943:108-1769(-)
MEEATQRGGGPIRGPRGGASASPEGLTPPAWSVAAGSVACAVISSFLFGYSICVLNSCGGLMAVVFEWCGNAWQSDCIDSRGSQGLVNASVYLGAAVGALLSGRPFLSALGCRTQLIISDAYFAGGAIFGAFARGTGTLIVGRFASGMGLGISAIAAPLYIAEISPRERRGIHAAMHGVFITLGILASITFGLPQGPPPSSPEDGPLTGLDTWYWRGLLGFPALCALVQAVLFTWVCPMDPPALLVRSGKMDEARKLLYRIYGQAAPASSMNMNDRKQALLELQLNELEDAVSMAMALPKIWMVQAMCDPFLRTAVFLGGGLAAFQQLCGINGLMSYSNSLFQEAGVAPRLLTLASTLMAVANVAASVLSSKMVDRLGRRRLLLTGAMCQTLSMAALSISTGKHSSQLLPEGATGPLTVICFSLFCMSFSFGLGAVTWIYLSEIYPMEIRGPALSACGVINWVSSFLVVFGTPFMSLRVTCHVFGLICLLGTISTYMWVVETKGCSMDDSPLTPKSGRSSSPLLTPRGNYKKMSDDPDRDPEFTLQTGNNRIT